MNEFDAELTAMLAAWIRVNAKGIIIYINGFGAQMFGYYSEELIGRPLSILIPMRDQARQAAGFAKAVKSAEYHASSFFVNAQKKDGSIFTVWHKIGKCKDYFVAIIFTADLKVGF